jgi:glycine hydroxymethyltransferase
MAEPEAARCAELVDRVLRATTAVGDTDFRLDPAVRREVRDEVAELCHRFPIPAYRGGGIVPRKDHDAVVA